MRLPNEWVNARSSTRQTDIWDENKTPERFVKGKFKIGEGKDCSGILTLLIFYAKILKVWSNRPERRFKLLASDSP